MSKLAKGLYNQEPLDNPHFSPVPSVFSSVNTRQTLVPSVSSAITFDAFLEYVSFQLTQITKMSTKIAINTV